MGKVIRDPEIMERMQTMLELFELSVIMQRQNIRRRHPELGPDEVEERVQEWLASRPDEEHRDGKHFRLRRTSD